MPTEHYRRFVRRISPTVLLGYWGERLYGTLAGVVWDLIADGLTWAVESPWLTRATQPEDALPVIADERSLPKYVVETNAQWRERLLNAWDIWERGGAFDLIEEQLEAAGFPGAKVYSPIDWNRPPAPYWSHFWIFLPEASHAGLFGTASLAGSGAIAGQHLCGISGPTERATELRFIAQKFRPGHVICRQIIVEFEAATCGTGQLAGSHLCGGRQATIGMGIAAT